MIDFVFTGKHDTRYFMKRAAAAYNSTYHSGQMFICGELFGVPVAVVLFGCPMNIVGQNEI
jgi:hypothetical protein